MAGLRRILGLLLLVSGLTAAGAQETIGVLLISRPGGGAEPRFARDLQEGLLLALETSRYRPLVPDGGVSETDDARGLAARSGAIFVIDSIVYVRQQISIDTRLVFVASLNLWVFSPISFRIL